MDNKTFYKFRETKNVVKTVLVVFTLIGLTSFFPEEKNQEFTEEIVSNFKDYLLQSIEEKVYLQTDKPYYSAGENIWFKGYLVNAVTLQPQSLSQYLYVELINRMDSVVSRVKIQKDSTGFAGYIKLKPELPSGDYNLRAYTHWMQNNSTDFFFHKALYIGNSIDDEINCSATYDTPSNGKILVNLQLLNKNSQPITGTKIQVSQHWSDSKPQKRTYMSDSSGISKVSIPYQPALHESANLDVLIDDKGFKYHTRIYLPDFNPDFDVQFFPESGVFLNNCVQVVAFKAIGTDGLSEAITGKIYSDQGVEKATIVSSHKGMGEFLLKPIPGESYYAIIKSEKGDEKRIDLPLARDEGVALHVGILRDKVVYEIIDKRKDSSTPLHLLVHARGVPHLIMPITKLSGQLRQEKLIPGIYTISILDNMGNILCERLFFSRPANSPSIEMKTDKDVYVQREAVNLSFKIQTANGESPAGNYSVSITDRQLILNDSLNDNMESYLLLSSDIKGHIEDPLSYFVGSPVVQNYHLDLLMQTQAWRRYNTTEITQHRFKKPEFYMEAGQTLSGSVLNFFGRPAKQCNVYAWGPRIFQATTTDSLGRYLIDGIQFQDSTSFILKAQKNRSITDMEIVPDQEVFPPSHTFFPAPQAIQHAFPAEYFEQSKQKYYIEGGMRMIHLDEVKVYGENKSVDQPNDYFSGLADTEIDAKEIEQFNSSTLLTLLSTLPGVLVTGNEVRIRGSQGNPYLLIDGVPAMDFSELNTIEPSIVARIEVFKGANAAIFGLKGGNGVIAVTIKKGVVVESARSVSMTQCFPLGVQKPEQFYVPKYEVQKNIEDPNPDMRTTIYWNPSLMCDSTGTLNMTFYTADPADDYSVTLEGITDNGEICHYEGIIRRTYQ